MHVLEVVVVIVVVYAGEFFCLDRILQIQMLCFWSMFCCSCCCCILQVFLSRVYMQLENMFKKYVHLLRDMHACTASPHRNSTSVLSEVVFERSNTSVSSQTGVILCGSVQNACRPLYGNYI